MPAKKLRGRPRGVQHDDIVFFRCEKAMHQRLKELAAADDRPIAQYVRQLIKRHFAEVEKEAASAKNSRRPSKVTV